ncbi:hypothetical protein F2Q70_00027455 [Brassica cretica]|uniref:Uncharacterized protein n=2 Tax=Brassica cretica TaxID=69181 RepID=A0A8S9MV41_BRACR|nr:hypothetical protein F2Q70_00027455 [Brassica cretica]KAF2620923.1 hypothetical protein F2Q68_00040460 [Brassica cretica]KAF3498480.1 hypothetical protein DY000_02054468 [Brassica cretica]
MEYFPIPEMPEEIQALVVERVAGPCSLQLIFRRSTVANVQFLWSDNVSACGTLM